MRKLILTILIILISQVGYSYSRIWVGEDNNKMLVGIEVKYQNDDFLLRFENEIRELKCNAINSFTPGYMFFTTEIGIGMIGYQHTCKHLFDKENFVRDVKEKIYLKFNY